MADLQLHRVLPAQPGEVYAALTEPDLMARWFCPNPDLVTTVEADARVGGAYTVAMGPHVVSGVYADLQPERAVELTWRWEGDDTSSTVRFQLAAAEGGTRLSLHQQGLADADDVAAHEIGWAGSLDRLPSALAR